jgi:hypothetical protein
MHQVYAYTEQLKYILQCNVIVNIKHIKSKKQKLYIQSNV